MYMVDSVLEHLLKYHLCGFAAALSYRCSSQFISSFSFRVMFEKLSLSIIAPFTFSNRSPLWFEKVVETRGIITD
jgi:hypothetical protein